jgi:phosphomannomutase
VPDAVRNQLRDWSQAHDLAAIVSTDADGDRPLLADQHGEVVCGDVLGQITARGLGAKAVVTPVSSNSGVVLGGRFETVVRTKIGSPYVIQAMSDIQNDVVGYEANGGFILGFDAKGPCGPVSTLLTRDALLPILMVLSMAGDDGVAGLLAQEPACITASDRLPDIDTQAARAVIAGLVASFDARAAFLRSFDAKEVAVDQTDGLRMTMADGRIVHLRLSGNAPELRVYAEAHSDAAAQAILSAGLQAMRRMLAAA